MGEFKKQPKRSLLDRVKIIEVSTSIIKTKSKTKSKPKPKPPQVNNDKEIFVNIGEKETNTDFLHKLEIEQIKGNNQKQGDQYLSVDIYLDTNAKNKIRKTYESVLELIDKIEFDFYVNKTEKFGSWFKRFYLVSKKTMKHPEVKKKLDEIEFGLKKHLIEKEISEIDKNLSESIKNIIESLSSVPSAVIKLSSLLIVKRKTPPFMIVKKLSIDEMIFIEKNPDILNIPDKILNELAKCDNVLDKKNNANKSYM